MGTADDTQGKPRQRRDRHKAVKVVLGAGLVLLVPVVMALVDSMNDQLRAVDEWVEVPCVIRESKAVNNGKKKRIRFTAEWGVDIQYTYIWNGVNTSSSGVWYYGTSTGKSWKLANDLVEGYPAGSTQTAFVNPDKPNESILVRELWFRPYGLLLLASLFVQIVCWWFAVEYDWSQRRYSPSAFPKAPEPGWYQLHASTHSKPFSFYLPFFFLAFTWHFLGYLIAAPYWARPHSQFGHTEQTVAYHFFGVVVSLRLAYLSYFAYAIGGLNVWVSSPKLVVDNCYSLRVMQEVGKPGGVFYKKVVASLMLNETTQIQRNNKTQRHSNALYRKDHAMAADLAVEKGPGLDLQCNPLVFPDTPSSDTNPKPNARVWREWHLLVELSIRGLPSHITSVPVTVHPHPTS